MESFPNSITPETEQLLLGNGGPLQIVGAQGQYVVMRLDVYDAMLGVTANDGAETMASVRRAMADVDAGRTHDAKEALSQLEARRDWKAFR